MNTSSFPWGLQVRLFLCFLLWALIGLCAAPLTQAQEPPEYESQVVVVQVEPGVAIVEGAAKTGLEVFDRTAADYGVHTIERVFPFLDYVQPTPNTERNIAALRRTYYVRYSAGDDPERVAKALASAPGVIYAEPVIINRLLESEVRAEPDDSLFSDQTYLRHLRLPEAWDIVRGEDMSPPVVIAIVDNGSYWRHEDLLANVWTNANEIPGNGIDDDNNGFIDDVHGANFCNRDDTNNDPFEPTQSWHGTPVAGTASGVTNNGTGVAGAAWNAQLMYICGGYQGVLYAAANGADIINASWGGGGDLQVSLFIAQSIDLATDMGALVVASAGNDNRNSDLYPFYPSSYPRVLSVGATAKDSRKRASFSNYGKMVNVFAPGVGIITTEVDGGYNSSASGTSFSAPLVSGVAALVKTRYPTISPDALREQIRLASEHMDAENPGQAGQLGRGYVNAEASLKVPAFPAVRLKRWTWDDTDGDLMIMSGEEVTIKAVFINYLADAQQLSIGLTAAESYPYIDLSNAEQTVGHLARGDSTEVTLRFVVANNAPPSRVIRFYSRIRDGAFVDEPDRLSFGINARIKLDHAALSALYTSTGGSSWRENRNWDITTVPTPSELARWSGVIVSHGILSGLRLHRNNLTGTLPAELGNLQGLEDLRLPSNKLSGEIPPELGNLSQLRWLDLGANSLSGEIPNELGNLSQLIWLDLHDNVFTGRLPRSLMQLTNLKELLYSGQDLCAPGDDAFQTWLRSIPHVSGPTCLGIHFIDSMADQSFPRAQPIAPIVLPEATGGAPSIDYTLTPILPAGLAFDHANRTLSGSPTVVTPATPYTYKATDANGSTDSLSFSIEVYSPTNVEHESLPEAFVLHGNFPNPSRHTTQLLMDLPWPARVMVKVMDVIGRRVLTVPSDDLTAGWQRSVNLSVAALPSGLYLYRVHASSPGGHTVHMGRFVHVR